MLFMTFSYSLQMSDRYGRTRIVGINMLGGILNFLIFIFVALFAKRLPGGYWLIIIGPIIEGLLGGELLQTIVCIYQWSLIKLQA
jgi:MFS family permease